MLGTIFTKEMKEGLDPDGWIIVCYLDLSCPYPHLRRPLHQARQRTRRIVKAVPGGVRGWWHVEVPEGAMVFLFFIKGGFSTQQRSSARRSQKRGSCIYFAPRMVAHVSQRDASVVRFCWKTNRLEGLKYYRMLSKIGSLQRLPLRILFQTCPFNGTQSHPKVRIPTDLIPKLCILFTQLPNP